MGKKKRSENLSSLCSFNAAFWNSCQFFKTHHLFQTYRTGWKTFSSGHIRIYCLGSHAFISKYCSVRNKITLPPTSFTKPLMIMVVVIPPQRNSQGTQVECGRAVLLLVCICLRRNVQYPWICLLVGHACRAPAQTPTQAQAASWQVTLSIRPGMDEVPNLSRQIPLATIFTLKSLTQLSFHMSKVHHCVFQCRPFPRA